MQKLKPVYPFDMVNDMRTDYAKKMQPIIDKEVKDLGTLLASKAEGYGPSWKTTAEVLAAFFPNGIPVNAYEDVLLLIRVLDKLARLANNLSHNQGDPLGESPWKDLAGYGVIGVAKEEFKKNNPGK